MRKISLILLISFFTITINSQNFKENGGEYLHNKENIECLSQEERNTIIQALKENQLQLSLENKRLFSEENRGASVLFDWPVEKSAGSNYESIWGISNYVDHDAAYPNVLSDYNCGTRTYDTNSGYNHRGIDIYTWPFSWKIMDNDEAEVLAAAPGQIVYKSDGNYDRSCSLGGGNWNAIYVEHSDGTVAWYGHMKNGSLTSKGIGDVVSQGEFLGVVGSSGNSTGPHLHFEVWQDDSYNNLLDPYAGPCNNLNAVSMWQSQKPYLNPNINAVLTHSAPPVFPACPTTETTNESNQFDTSDTVYFAIYLRDQMDLTSINLKIIKPDNSVLYNWDFDFTADYYSSYWYWYFTGVFDQEGQWKWEASYLGQTVSHTLNIGDNLSVEDQTIGLTTIYPNPAGNLVSVKTPKALQSANIYDIGGKLIKSFNLSNINSYDLDITNIAKGMYFLSLVSVENEKESFKIIKR